MSNSFLLRADHPRQTLENCVRVIEFLKLADISGNGMSETAEMGQFLILGELSKALESVGDNFKFTPLQEMRNE